MERRQVPLRSRPPFTGVLLGPGPESAPRSAFWAILGTCLGVHAKKHSKSTLWGTPRQVPKIAQKALRGALCGPGPKSTPVNGGRDRQGSLTSMRPLQELFLTGLAAKVAALNEEVSVLDFDSVLLALPLPSLPLEKRKHTPPCSSAELFFAEKYGGHRGKISVVDMVFLVLIGFSYPPLTWQVFLRGQKSSPNYFLSVVVVYAFFFSAHFPSDFRACFARSPEAVCRQSY